MKSFVRLAAAACLPGLIAACTSSTAVISESTEHCKSALGRIVGPNDSVFVYDTNRARGTVDGRTVETVTLQIAINDKPVVMNCTYASGASNANSITFAGRPMSSDQLATVNRAVSDDDEPFTVLRKRLPTLPGVNVDQTQGKLGHSALTPPAPASAQQGPGEE